MDEGPKPLATVRTPGRAADSPQFTGVLQRIRVPRRSGPGRPRTRPDRMRVDNAYSAHRNQPCLRRLGVPATIPIKADQAVARRTKGSVGGRQSAFHPGHHGRRHAVECGIKLQKQNRAFAIRYDKLPGLGFGPYPV